MKSFVSTTLTIAAALLSATSHAYVVNLFDGPDCTGAIANRNVFDSTCAPTGGFQSLELLVHGGGTQFLIAYGANGCFGFTNLLGSASGNNSLPLNTCFNTSNGLGGSNALGSFGAGITCTSPSS